MCDAVVVLLTARVAVDGDVEVVVEAVVEVVEMLHDGACQGLVFEVGLLLDLVVVCTWLWVVQGEFFLW